MLFLNFSFSSLLLTFSLSFSASESLKDMILLICNYFFSRTTVSLQDHLDWMIHIIFTTKTKTWLTFSDMLWGVGWGGVLHNIFSKLSKFPITTNFLAFINFLTRFIWPTHWENEGVFTFYLTNSLGERGTVYLLPDFYYLMYFAFQYFFSWVLFLNDCQQRRILKDYS